MRTLVPQNKIGFHPINRTLSKTWLQPGAIGKSNLKPFQRLYGGAKTVETVWALSSGNTGLKPGVNEKAA
jgi:hypothetical protein